MVTEHHLMIPYVRSLMDENIRTGLAPMRAMFIEFPDDPAVEDLPDQYMYGSHLLIAPVVQQGATSRKVYLPTGEWIDYNDRQSRINSTGQTVNVDAPIDEVPSFVRAGAIIPKGDIVKGNNNWTANWQPWVDIEAYLPSEAEAQNQFDYYTGQSTKPIELTKDAEAVVLQFEDLRVAGKLKVYLDSETAGKLADGSWNVYLNGQQLGAGQYSIQDGLLTVAYRGETELRLSAAPEPATVAILGLAGTGLVVRKR
jgi:alpha-glucosidase (family GH31 glycosyl hydrolase)